MPGNDFYQRNQDLDELGLFQLAAEEAARPGKRTPKSTRILKALIESLELFDAQVREIEDLVEKKRRAGLLGKVRKFSRRQLYARCIRYTHWKGDPSPANAALLAKLRDAMGFAPADHEALLERLIDQGWAPPGPLTRVRPKAPGEPETGELTPAEPERGARQDPPKDAPAQGEAAAGGAEAEEVGSPEDPDAPPARPGPVDADEISDSQDLATPSAAHPRPDLSAPEAAVEGGPPPAEAEAEAGLFDGVTPSGAMELRGEQESADSLQFDPFETTASAKKLKRGQAAGAPPSTRQQFWMGAGIGAMIVLVPLAFWLGTQHAPPPPGPTPQDWPTAPPPSPSPSPEPSPTPTPKPAKPSDPWKAFMEDLPPTGESAVSGASLLQAMGQRLIEAEETREPLKNHAQARRADINRTFARRNEQIFEATQWGGESGDYSRESLQEARALLVEAEGDRAALPARLVHAYYLGLLGFYLEARRYPDHGDVYGDLVGSWVKVIEARPGITGSGAGMVLRVIGEDLRDSRDEDLAKLGERLLEALL